MVGGGDGGKEKGEWERGGVWGDKIGVRGGREDGMSEGLRRVRGGGRGRGGGERCAGGEEGRWRRVGGAWGDEKRGERGEGGQG